MIHRVSIRRGLPTACVASLLALPGCSDEDSQKSDRESPRTAGRGETPAARDKPGAADTRLKAFADEFAGAIEGSDCEAFRGSFVSTYAPAASECRERIERLAGFETSGVKTYGSGGLIDFRSGTPGTVLVVANADRRWRVVGVARGKGRAIKTKPRGTADFEMAARRLVEAGRSCRRLGAVLTFPTGPEGVSRRREGEQLGRGNCFANRLAGLPEKAAASAEPVRPDLLGATSRFAFSRVSVGRTGWTIVLERAPRARVLAVVPGPVAEP